VEKAFRPYGYNFEMTFWYINIEIMKNLFCMVQFTQVGFHMGIPQVGIFDTVLVLAYTVPVVGMGV